MNELPRWKLPSNYEDLFQIALAFDAGPEPVVNGHIWTETRQYRDANQHHMRVDYRGPDSWAITRGGSLNLSNAGDWDYEPMNSNKTEDFLKRHRFKTARAAIEIADHFRNRLTLHTSLEREKNSAHVPGNGWIGSDDQRIFSAITLAYEAHHGQFRKYVDNVPYITHPQSVASQTEAWLLCNHRMSERRLMSVAAWWHDIEEDCPPEFVAEMKEVDPEAYELVRELTNPSKKYPHLRRGERKKMDREHIGQVSWRAKVIKLIDRRSNLMEISSQPAEPDFKRLYAVESEMMLPFLQGPDTKDLEEEYMVWVRHLLNTKE